jgi:hypothetical protein
LSVPSSPIHENPRFHPRPARADRRRRLLRGRALGAAVVAPVLVAALALAGCGGGSSSGTNVDPASVVPASAPVFLGADVRPSGQEQKNALAVGTALTHRPDPYAQLAAVLQTPGSPPIEYSRDVAPWLGPHAGLFATSTSGAAALLPIAAQGLLGTTSSTAEFPFATGRLDGAIVLDTSDAGKARSFVEAQAAHAGAHATSYHGVSYKVTAAGVAFAIVDRFAVFGSDAGVRAVIDTAAGGSSLHASADYERLLSQSPPGTLAHLFTNPTAGGAAATAAAGSGGALSLFAGPRESNISLVPGSQALSVFADTRASGATGTPGGLLTASAEGTRAMEELPATSWLALGLGNVGHTLGADISGLGEVAALVGLAGPPGSASSGTISVGGLVEGLLAPLKALASTQGQARRDLTSWMGSGGVFASGTGLLELQGAVVIESHNPAASREAVGKLAALLAHSGNATKKVSIPGTDAAAQVQVPGLPLQLYIANGQDASGGTKFVLGLGEASVTTALHPQGTFASAPANKLAAETLGEGITPNLVFDVTTLVGLLEGVGLAEDPAFAKIAPYAHAITRVVGGGHKIGGEVERYKLVIDLRPAGG